MKQSRPVNVNIFQYRFPIPAIISILHRISGVVIFVAMPFLLYLLHRSLVSRDSFLALRHTLSLPITKFFVWIVLAAITFHVVAGIRHMIMDLGFAESLSAGRASAIAVLILSAVLMTMFGVWLW